MALGGITIKLAKTLRQVEEILEANPDAQEEIKQTIETAIEKLHSKTINGEVTLVLTDEASFKIKPKKEYKDYLHTLTGSPGPYKVIKTYKSMIGLSDGVYELENCDQFIPVSWCKEKKCTAGDNLKFLSIVLAVCSVAQSAALLLILF